MNHGASVARVATKLQNTFLDHKPDAVAVGNQYRQMLTAEFWISRDRWPARVVSGRGW